MKRARRRWYARHHLTRPRDRGKIAMSPRWLLAASLIGAAACAIDAPAGGSGGNGGGGSGGAGDGNGGSGAAGGADVVTDGGADLAPIDHGTPPMEPPLTVMDCAAANPAPNVLCCQSALGFEDGSSQHFLTPACCQMALLTPQVVSTPTACGRAALRMDADFRVADASALCGQPGEAPACAHQMGQVSRAVLAPLDLTGLTLSAVVYLDGPPLPDTPAHGSVFVVGRAGLVEGSGYPISQLGTWTRLELSFVADTLGQGVDIRVLGIRMTLHGQPWVGRAYLDEITWH